MISREMVIAAGFTGLKLGRSGTLVWVTVATSSMVFLFDMAKIGPAKAMKEGFGAVLQDGSVVKVVHDCRAVEDLLHHQLNINLKNVFDTQVRSLSVHRVTHLMYSCMSCRKYVLHFLIWNYNYLPSNVLTLSVISMLIFAL